MILKKNIIKIATILPYKETIQKIMHQQFRYGCQNFSINRNSKK